MFRSSKATSWFVRKLPRGKTVTYILLLLVIIPGQALLLFRGLDPAEKLGCEAILLAVAAIVVAVRHAAGLETMEVELRAFALSVPTRGIGVFPSYMSEVAGLVGRATTSITILCDTPAHGAFSNSVAFEKYWKTLRSMMVDGDVKIKCTFFDANGRRELHAAQIADDMSHWNAWKERNRAHCEAFDRLAQKARLEPSLPRNGDGPVATWADTPSTYVDNMMAINAAVLESFDPSVTIEQLDFSDPLHEGPSVYFWLRDEDQEAVFVIVPVQGIGVRDLAGFHTREPELIRALGTVYEHRSPNNYKVV